MTFVASAVVVAVGQFAAVTFAALPTNRYSEAVAPHTTYLSPMFTQNWRLFAPNPIAEDRRIQFQGTYRAEDGTLAETDWVDWTAVELDLVHHRLIGGRAGYVTNKLFGPLGSRYGGLLAEQQAIADRTEADKPPSWAELSNLLLEAGPNKPRSIATFLRYDRATTRLATTVLTSRWPDRTFVSVRYSLGRQAVTPYDARGGSPEERESARPRETVRIGGWRVPEVGDAAERRVIADFDRRHR